MCAKLTRWGASAKKFRIMETLEPPRRRRMDRINGVYNLIGSLLTCLYEKCFSYMKRINSVASSCIACPLAGHSSLAAAGESNPSFPRLRVSFGFV